MRRKIFTVCILALLMLRLALPAGAYETGAVLLDEAGLLTLSQETELLEHAGAIGEDYRLSVAIILADGLEGYSPEAYAGERFDECFGPNSDGILFLLSMEERDWYIYTGGSAMELFDDDEVYESFEDIKHHISGGDYHRGFTAWLDILPYYLDSDDDYGYDYEEDPDYGSEGDDVLPNIWICLGVGAAAALIVVLIMRSGMNTRRQQQSARHYMTAGSYHLNTQQDFFLYSTVTKTARPKDTGSGSSGSGGRSHGGGGGKF